MLDSAMAVNFSARNRQKRGRFASPRRARTIRPFREKWSPVAWRQPAPAVIAGRSARAGCSGPLARRRCGRPGRPLRRRRLRRRSGGGRGVGGGRGDRRSRRRVVGGRFDGVVLDLLFHRAQLGDVLLMLIVGFREGSGRRCRRRRRRGRACAPDWRRPPARRARDWRSAPAAGPRSHRYCRARAG